MNLEQTGPSVYIWLFNAGFRIIFCFCFLCISLSTGGLKRDKIEWVNCMNWQTQDSLFHTLCFSVKCSAITKKDEMFGLCGV